MVKIYFFFAGLVTYNGHSFIGSVDRTNGTSFQLEAETDVENGTLNYTLAEVTDGQESGVSVNSTGFLTISPVADDSFFIDVSYD